MTWGQRLMVAGTWFVIAICAVAQPLGFVLRLFDRDHGHRER